MRLQLGFPDTFTFIQPENYLQYVTMHGMIMVVYLLTAILLGGLCNYLIPLLVGARDMVFPYVNMLSYWVYLLDRQSVVSGQSVSVRVALVGGLITKQTRKQKKR